MQRSGGITASAVVAILVSVFAILFGLLIVLVAVMTDRTALQAEGSSIPPAASAMVLARATVLYIAFGVWGIISAIGLLRLRNWARICVAIFAGILAFVSLCVAVVFLVAVRVVPQGLPSGNNTPPGLLTGAFSVIAVIALLTAGLEMWWVFYLNRRQVKFQFPGEVTASAPPKIPLSITIIAWIFIVSGIVILPQLLAPTSTLFFSFIFRGSAARLVYFLLASLNLVSGIGILKRIQEAYAVAVVYLCFSLMNSLAGFLIPGAYMRRQSLLQELQGSVAVFMPMNALVMFFIVIGLLSSLAGLWFLMTRRQAFLASTVQ